MNAAFLIFTVFLLFMIFLNPIEPFNDGQTFVGSAKPTFVPTNKNDFYFDRTGRKGIMFNKLSDKKIWKMPKKTTTPVYYDNTIKKLELYPNKMYAPCASVNFDKILPPVYKNDPNNTYLTFNQGVLYNQIN